MNIFNSDKEKLYQYVNRHFWVIYTKHTNTLSNTCRQLALGEGGICWFIISSKDQVMPLQYINWILILLVLFFIFDAAQYLFSSLAYKNLSVNYTKQIKSNIIKHQEQLVVPDEINKYSNRCFILKILTLSCASLFLTYVMFIKSFC